MPHGGTLTIATEVCHLDGRIQPWRQVSSNSGHVLLTVLDTGQGIPADAISKIFQPFYTTKPEGKGTGLGLATVERMVKQSGGHIDLESSRRKWLGHPLPYNSFQHGTFCLAPRRWRRK